MKTKLLIWSIGAIILLIFVNFAVGSILLGHMKLIAPQYMKYSEAIGKVIYNPEENIEDVSAALFVREALSDSKESLIVDEDSIIGKSFLKDWSKNSSTLFICENKEINTLAYGCWAKVYRDEPDKLREQDDLSKMAIRTSFAMFDMEKAINQGYGVELQNAIRNNEDIIIKVDEYALKDLELIPIHVVILNGDNVMVEFNPNSIDEVPDGFEYTKDDNAWIYNKEYQSLGERITSIDISDIKEIERLRDIAYKTASEIDFSKDIEDIDHDIHYKNRAILGKDTVVVYGIRESEDGSCKYAIVKVSSQQDGGLFLYCSAILLVGWTVLFGIIVFIIKIVKKLKKSSDY